MLFKIFKFEIRYWLQQPMVYIFLFINALLIFGASSSENITIGSSIGNVHKNAPYVVENFYSVMAILSLLMITAFLNSAAARDYAEKTNQILFTTTIKKRDFLLGRYFGACFISIIPFLGIALGSILGSMMPWLDAERTGATYWSAHLNGLLVFSIPNILFAGSIIFSIAALTRNTVTSFIGTILILVGYGISQSLIRNLDNEFIGSLLDPFGARAFSIATKYWTVDDKNTTSWGLHGIMLLNRLIWLAVGACVMIFTYYRFSFSEKSKKSSKNSKTNEDDFGKMIVQEEIRFVKPEFSSGFAFKQFISQVKIEVKGILKNTGFIVILFAGLLNLVAAMTFITDGGYGNKSFPVTYNVIDTITGSLSIFLISIISFYTGVMVWRERDAKVNDIYDALPFSGWIPFLSKTIAMILTIEVVLIIACTTGIIAQYIHGFYTIKLNEYLIEILLFQGITLTCYIILSMFIHTLVNNKYIGYFIFIIVLIANSFIWPVFHVSSNMVSYGSSTSMTFSDMNKFGPFLTAVLWFKTYWILFASLLVIGGMSWWVRGRETGMKIRMLYAKEQFRNNYKVIFSVLLITWIICGSFIFYNTKVLNHYRSDKESEALQVDYEKMYKKYEKINQPRIVDVKYQIDLFPEARKLNVKADFWIKNKGAAAIDSVHFSLIDDFTIKINLINSKLIYDDKQRGYQIYKLSKALQPGDSIPLQIETSYAAKGFENEVSNTSIVQNGTFFNNSSILPQIGYQPNQELSDRDKRKENGLKEKARMPALERNCNANCMNTYISNNSDWVNVETIFSTSLDQIAVAPGSLIKNWVAGNRNYYHYKLDHPSLDFYSFISANFKVKREKWNGIDIEVYYMPEHEWNVNKMISSMEHSLDYYIKNFGPYQHHQTRVIEFPRYASFAQSFPGTMPYSEGIGFIQNLTDSENIDMVYYIVAHEMGHQYWAHQVTGAEMQGATLLSETMAQYSALMVMEKMYGKDQMHKFLKFEMDNYLRSRGTERVKESPLLKVENQGYIHYRKGSVVMYYLKEMIGEAAINRALKNVIDSFAYRQPPYPTAYELVDRLDKETPDSLKYLIKDLFYDITLFNNRTTDASYKKLPNGKYEVSFAVSAEKLKADSLGHESKVAINDWIEIGVLSKPADGKKYGKKLYSQLVKINSEKKSFTVVVNELPYEAGIDPDYYLIDRIPDDNMKRIKN